MENKILVTYASTHGSTEEIAGVIAETLCNRELTVDLQPIRNVRSLAGYRAVLLGAPIYIFKWHKDARRFLTRHQTMLSSGLPVAIFAGGPFGPATEEEWHEVRIRFDQTLAEFSWLKPVSVQIFGGRFDPAKLRLPYSLIPAMHQMPPSDLRDWDAIRAWADNLAVQFSITTPDQQPVVAKQGDLK
jgi:menaquinone-dependent protoporphyrinogen oxidase